MIPATVIVIEGPDKVGKETQAALLAESLRAQGWRVKTAEVPVNDRVTYPLIYWMLRKGHAKPYPRLFQFLQFLNKWFWQLLMPYYSWKYDYVILDRWAASAVIYGQATGISSRFNTFLYRRLMKPDLTIVLLGPPHTRKELVDDTYEADTELQSRVRCGYEWWAAIEERAELIDNQGGRDVVNHRIMKVLDARGLL